MSDNKKIEDMGLPDDKLREAAREAMEIWNEKFMESETDEHVFSLEFEEKMQDIIKVSEQKRTRFAWMNRAAGFAVALLFGLMATIMMNYITNADILHWIRKNEDASIVYRGIGEQFTDIEKVDYAFGYLPEGYFFSESKMILKHMRDTVYLDMEGNDINFVVVLSGDGSVLDMEKDGYQLTNTMVNGNKADFYQSVDGGDSVLVWEDRKNGVMLGLMADLPEDELIRIAEHVYAKPAG